jgi:hypothetical protein
MSFSFFFGLVVLVIGLSLILFSVSSFKSSKDSFEVKESKRYFFGFNEIAENWSSNGRVFCTGLALIEDKKTGKKKFIKQAELCDIGILT